MINATLENFVKVLIKLKLVYESINSLGNSDLFKITINL